MENDLPEREREILRALIDAGFNTPRAAKQTHQSLSMAKHYLGKAMHRLGYRSYYETAHWADKLGLID